MSTFAQIDKDGVVQRVVVATQEFIDTGKLGEPLSFIETSYNTKGGFRIDPVTKIADKNTQLRKNYAGVGDIYDKDRDAFIKQKPSEEAFLDEEKGLWIDPVAEIKYQTELKADSKKDKIEKI